MTTKVGFLGGGNVGGALISRLVKQEVGFEVVAVGLKRLNVPRMFPSDALTDDLQSIIDNPDIDAIVCALPPSQELDEVIANAENSGKIFVTIDRHFYDETPEATYAERRENGIAAAEALLTQLNSMIENNSSNVTS